MNNGAAHHRKGEQMTKFDTTWLASMHQKASARVPMSKNDAEILATYWPVKKRFSMAAAFLRAHGAGIANYTPKAVAYFKALVSSGNS